MGFVDELAVGGGTNVQREFRSVLLEFAAHGRQARERGKSRSSPARAAEAVNPYRVEMFLDEIFRRFNSPQGRAHTIDEVDWSRYRRRTI